MMTGNKDDAVRMSWFDMADKIIKKLFLTKATSVSVGALNEEEADKFIIDKAHEYAEKYENMSTKQLHMAAMADMLETLSRAGGG